MDTEQIKKARAMAGRMREMADHPNEPWAENAIRTGSYYEGLRLEAATIDRLCDVIERVQAGNRELLTALKATVAILEGDPYTCPKCGQPGVPSVYLEMGTRCANKERGV